MLNLAETIASYLGEKDIYDSQISEQIHQALREKDFGGGDEWELILKVHSEIERLLTKQGYPDLTLSEYQDRTADTAIYPSELALPYLIAGLTSEAGEVASEFKKAIRDDGSDGVSLTDDREQKILEELGDVLWYVASLAKHLDCDLDAIACRNLEKLQARKADNYREQDF